MSFIQEGQLIIQIIVSQNDPLLTLYKQDPLFAN